MKKRTDWLPHAFAVESDGRDAFDILVRKTRSQHLPEMARKRHTFDSQALIVSMMRRESRVGSRVHGSQANLFGLTHEQNALFRRQKMIEHKATGFGDVHFGTRGGCQAGQPTCKVRDPTPPILNRCALALFWCPPISLRTCISASFLSFNLPMRFSMYMRRKDTNNLPRALLKCRWHLCVPFGAL